MMMNIINKVLEDSTMNKVMKDIINISIMMTALGTVAYAAITENPLYWIVFIIAILVFIFG